MIFGGSNETKINIISNDYYNNAPMEYSEVWIFKKSELPMDVDGEADRRRNPGIMETGSDSTKDKIAEPSWFSPKK